MDMEKTEIRGGGCSGTEEREQTCHAENKYTRESELVPTGTEKSRKRGGDEGE